MYCAIPVPSLTFRANCPRQGRAIDFGRFHGLKHDLARLRQASAAHGHVRSRVIPEKLVHYAAETSALIYALWALALIFFIALVNVSLMLGMAWMRERSRKERERRIRIKLAGKDQRIAELEIENRVLAEFRKRAEQSINVRNRVHMADTDSRPVKRVRARPAETMEIGCEGRI